MLSSPERILSASRVRFAQDRRKSERPSPEASMRMACKKIREASNRLSEEGKKGWNSAQFFCGNPAKSTLIVLAAAVVWGVFGRRDMVFANMAGSFFSPIA